MRRILAHVALVASAAVLTGCPLDIGGDDEPRVCTMMLTAVTLDARDEAGRPVPVDSVSVRRASGEELVCTSDQSLTTGCVQPLILSMLTRTRFAVVHSGVDVSRRGETFAVTATAGALRGTASVAARSDGCHVHKMSGPSEIVVR